MVTAPYKDLCKEIESLELRISDLEKERKYYTKLMGWNAPKGLNSQSFDNERVTGDRAHMTLDRVIDRLNKIDEQLSVLDEILRVKQDAKRKIEKIMGEFEGLEYKVAYMRDVQGKPLDKIAEELGYSYDWIRKISSRVKKAQRRHKKIAKS